MGSTIPLLTIYITNYIGDKNSQQNLLGFLFVLGPPIIAPALIIPDCTQA